MGSEMCIRDRTPFEPLKGLPSTFLVSPEAEYLDFVLGAVTAVELENLVADTETLHLRAPRPSDVGNQWVFGGSVIG